MPVDRIGQDVRLAGTGDAVEGVGSVRWKIPARGRPQLPPRSASLTMWIAFCILVGVAYVVVLVWAAIALTVKLIDA
jgi:hypothetical protein